MPSPAQLTVSICAALVGATTSAQVTEGGALAGTATVVHAGAGAQTDPHVSGSRVSYTNRTGTSSSVHFGDLPGGANAAIPQDAGALDSISDVSGDVVVFSRRFPSTGVAAIFWYHLADAASPPQELAPPPPPAPGAVPIRRFSAAIGGDTVAFQQFSVSSSGVSDVCVADLDRPADAAQCLTDDGTVRSNAAPAVSPDGNVVVFQKCLSPDTGCDIHAAHRAADGTWGAPVAITTGGGNDLAPDTNGTLVVYASDAAASGDYDVYYEPTTGTGVATRLELTDAPGSDETNPSLSGSLIAFERAVPPDDLGALWVFDIGENALYEVPSHAGPDVDDHLSDLSVAADGTAHVVWASVDPAAPGDGDNVYAFTFDALDPAGEATSPFRVCSLFDATRAFRLGGVAPLRIRLCDAGGANLSDPAVVPTATELVKIDSTAGALAPDAAGNANPTNAFRYDDALEGYIYNLSTKGLSTGSWELRFTVSGDPAVHAVPFDLR